MKILIVSDTHGKCVYLDRVLAKITDIDLLIHLGDFESGEEYIEAVSPCKLEMVSGNNDYFTSVVREKIIMIGKYRVLLTHGNRYYVGSSTETIKKVGMEQNVDIVMFGHTHKPLIDISKNIILINPGSITQPRQEGRIPSFIIMEIDNKGDAHFTINYVK